MEAADTVAVTAAAVVGAVITEAVDTGEAPKAAARGDKRTPGPPGFRISYASRNSPSMSFFKIRPAPI